MYLLEKINYWLKIFRKNKYWYPSKLDSIEEWYNILDEMIDLSEKILNDDYTDIDQEHKDAKRFGELIWEYFFNLRL